MRDYASHLVAETTVAGDFENTGNVAFGRLAGFIFGKNSAGEKMNMTVPVTHLPLPEGGHRYRFVMERAYSEEDLPQPLDESVDIVRLPGGPYAARYILCQTLHEKKIPHGYVTNLSMTGDLLRDQAAWITRVKSLREGDSDSLPRALRSRDIDLIVLNKTISVSRTPRDATEKVIWQPFGRVSGRLMPPRQMGAFVFRPPRYQPIQPVLRASFGEPIYEDESIAVFQAPEGGGAR